MGSPYTNAAKHIAGTRWSSDAPKYCHGGACAPQILEAARRFLAERGFTVAINAPYAGGFTTDHYGRPDLHRHALQIEISRALYLDEAKLSPTAGFEKLKSNLESLTRTLASADWSALRSA